MPGRTFTTSSAKRIAKAVRRVEQMPRKLDPGPARNRGPVPFLFRRFELKTSLAANGSAPAHPVVHDGSTWVTDTTASKEFTVHDVFGIYSGAAGLKGYAIKMHDFEDWEVFVMEC